MDCVYCVTLPTSTAVVLVDCGSCVLYTTYPSASVAFTAVQLMVALVAFLWSRVSSVGVKLGAEQEKVYIENHMYSTSLTSDVCLQVIIRFIGVVSRVVETTSPVMISIVLNESLFIEFCAINLYSVCSPDYLLRVVICESSTVQCIEKRRVLAVS